MIEYLDSADNQKQLGLVIKVVKTFKLNDRFILELIANKIKETKGTSNGKRLVNLVHDLSHINMTDVSTWKIVISDLQKELEGLDPNKIF